MSHARKRPPPGSPTRDTALDCLSLVARFHGVVAGPAELSTRLGPVQIPRDYAGLHQAAKLIGLKTRRVTRHFHQLATIPLPAIAITTGREYVVVARANRERVLVLDPFEATPRELTEPDFEADWSGEVVLVKRRSGAPSGHEKFGFSWFYQAIVKYRRLLAEVVVTSFFIQLFALITPLFFQVIIDKVLVHRSLTTLDVLGVGLLAVSFFEVVLGALRTYVFSHTTNRIDVSLGAELFRHLLALPMSYFEARRVGDTVARVKELESIRGFLTGSALTVVVDLCFTVVFLAVMYLYSQSLTLVVLGTLPCYAALSLLITPMLRSRLSEKFNRGAENHSFLVETIHGIQTIKSSATEPYGQKSWEERLASYVNASFRASNLSNLANQSAALINKVTVVLILWIGARLVMEGSLTIGQLVAFNMLAGRVSGPVLRMFQLWQEFQQAGISIARLGDILNTPREPSLNPGRTHPPALNGRISLDQVTFRYRPDGRDVLSKVSIDVSPGEIVAIVGASGSGKSTITKLIQRLHLPQSGRVLIDDIDLSLVDPMWLRRSIGVVLQESFLFNRPVRENIALGDVTLTMEQIVEAARLAGAHQFILELPEGYDTVVGEQGSSLSGGQKQRIAIARALVTNPRILIFDEATSALDYESERLIQNNMRTICRNRTVFIIAHRLTAIREAERIFVLEQGSIVESGKPGDLLNQSGHFARIHALQAESKSVQ